MNRTRGPHLLIFLLVSLLASGCEAVYRAETVLQSDGGVERAIYQLADRTPEAVRDPKGWKQTTYALPPAEMEKQGWPESLSKLPTQTKDDKHPYFAAWNSFRGVGDLPDHVQIHPVEGVQLPDGKLARDYVKTDYGFVVEHRWRETLNDIVTLEDMKKAREELADLLIKVGHDVFTETLGQDYDDTDLVKWCQTEGKEWVRELTDTFFVYLAAHKLRENDKSILVELISICARHGVKLKVEDLGPQTDLNKLVEDYVVDLLAQKVRTRNGQPVDKKVAAGWLKELSEPDQPMGKRNRFKVAIEKVIDDKYGGPKTFEPRLWTLIQRVAGLYLSIPLAASQFHYTMTMPGEIVETNGQLLSGNRVRWKFEAKEAYPFGYTMECRSLVLADKLPPALAKSGVLAKPEARIEYVSLVAGQRVLEVLKECQQKQDLKPLQTYKDTLEPDKRELEVQRLEKVKRLLKIE
jgi:hypothetical protein